MLNEKKNCIVNMRNSSTSVQQVNDMTGIKLVNPAMCVRQTWVSEKFS